jgi:hypothetical protein
MEESWSTNGVNHYKIFFNQYIINTEQLD